MIEIKPDLTDKERWTFALIAGALCGLLGWAALVRPEHLLRGAAVLGAALLVGLVFNREQPRRGQLACLGLLAVLILPGELARLGAPALAGAAAIWLIGLAAGGAATASPRAGLMIYRAWMNASAPIGWTISHLVLAAVFYLIVTPIGLTGRIFGRDPMMRRFDREAGSYWQPHEARNDPADYFRQH